MIKRESVILNFMLSMCKECQQSTEKESGTDYMWTGTIKIVGSCTECAKKSVETSRNRSKYT